MGDLDGWLGGGVTPMRRLRVLVGAVRRVGDRSNGADNRLLSSARLLQGDIDLHLLHSSVAWPPVPEGLVTDLSQAFPEGNVTMYTPASRNPRPRMRGLAPMANLPWGAAWSTALVRAVETLRPDVIHAELLPACRNVPADLRARTLAVAQDSWSRFSATRARYARPAWRRLAFLADAVAYTWAERCYRSFPLSVFVNERDARGVGGPRVRIISLGADAGELGMLPEEPVLVFAGNLSYGPNVHGLLRFIKRVLPGLETEVPGLTLVLAGREPDGELLREASRRRSVELAANPPDLRPFLRRARVVLVPVFWGAGQKTKILEALAEGRPVVCTPHAVAGSPLRDGEHLLVAGALEDWRRVLAGALKDHVLLESVRRAGHALVAGQLGWERHARAMAEAYEEVARGGLAYP